MWLVFALSAAVVFGIRGVLYQWSSKRSMNRNLMLFGVFFTGVIVAAICSFIFESVWNMPVLLGILMGLFSLIANASMYRGFTVGKASLIAILSSLPSVVVVLMAYLLWREALSIKQFAAFLVIITGILLIRYSSELSFRQLKGAGWGLLCMLFFGFNDLSGKQATKLDASLFPTIFFMFLTGSVGFYLLYRWELRYGNRNGPPYPLAAASEFGGPWSNRKTFLWGMLVGTTNAGGMMLIYQAFASGVTGLVSAVVALNVLIILFYARLILKETFSLPEFAGIVLSVSGVIMLQIFD